MATYRKKPVEIEAQQFHPDRRPWPVGVFAHTYATQCTMCHDSTWDHECNGSVKIDGYRIKTLEGVAVVTPGDWIITGIKGEKYPCKPDIFAATYELEGSRSDRDKIADIEILLQDNGCDCDCEHAFDEHAEDCERCLACQVQEAIR